MVAGEASAPPVLDLHVESYVRDGKVILEDVRWTIGAGEHWALLGANGSGKSTLLAIIAGYEWPTRGRVEVLGETYGRCDMRAMKQRIGLVSARLFDWLPARQTALEIAATGLYAEIGRWRVLSEEDLEQGREALSRIGALALADKRYGVLSQGERQRTMIARALVQRPDLLILDEPCAGLDPVARERFLEDVTRLCAAPEGPALLLVTHHVEEIRPPVGHGLLLGEGRVVAAGPLTEVLNDWNLTRTFGAPCSLDATKGRLALCVEPGPEAG